MSDLSTNYQLIRSIKAVMPCYWRSLNGELLLVPLGGCQTSNYLLVESNKAPTKSLKLNSCNRLDLYFGERSNSSTQVIIIDQSYLITWTYLIFLPNLSHTGQIYIILLVIITSSIILNCVLNFIATSVMMYTFCILLKYNEPFSDHGQFEHEKSAVNHLV